MAARQLQKQQSVIFAPEKWRGMKYRFHAPIKNAKNIGVAGTYRHLVIDLSRQDFKDKYPMVSPRNHSLVLHRFTSSIYTIHCLLPLFLPSPFIALPCHCCHHCSYSCFIAWSSYFATIPTASVHNLQNCTTLKCFVIEKKFAIFV